MFQDLSLEEKEHGGEEVRYHVVAFITDSSVRQHFGHYMTSSSRLESTAAI